MKFLESWDKTEHLFHILSIFHDVILIKKGKSGHVT